jgi:hypothetical protein
MLHQSHNANIQLSSNMAVPSHPPFLTTQRAPLISHYYTWNHKWCSSLFEELRFETRCRHGAHLCDGIVWPVKQRVCRLFQRVSRLGIWSNLWSAAAKRTLSRSVHSSLYNQWLRTVWCSRHLRNISSFVCSTPEYKQGSEIYNKPALILNSAINFIKQKITAQNKDFRQTYWGILSR